MVCLSEEQRHRFWQDGFLTLPNAVTEDALASMRADFARWVEESRKHDTAFGQMMDGRPRFDIEPGHRADRPALRRVASPTELSATFLEVLQTSSMTDRISELIGPNLRFHHSKINSKLPGTATTVKWHQDFTFDPHSNDDLITALLFLDDVSKANGPLLVAPGSHKGPLLSLWQEGQFTGKVAEAEAERLQQQAVQQIGPAGSVCLMHARTAHASGANHSDQPRTLFIAAVAAADAVPLSTNAVPSKHQGLILRGEEPGRIRSTAFEMEIPEVPKGASFFVQQAES